MTDVSSKGPAPGDDRKVLTNRQGHPVHDNQNQRTVGARGPATLENYQFLEKISHFDRERIPERVVHARGVTAYGWFEAYGTWGEEPISRYTRAKLFQERGKRTDVAVRFSTVIGGRDSSEAARDPRGFAVKFYTEDGNWDLVGNNLGVFFIRDAIKFPDVIHALKPDPVTFEQQPRRIFDFMSQTPESMHMLVNLFSPRGIPSDYRHMQGFGVNTYKWVNAEGHTVLVKYHWMPKQGVRSMTEEDAANVQAHSLGHATKDLYEAVARGDHPEWELLVQMMDDHDHPELDFDPLDDTKTWPEQDFPPKPVGRMVLDRMPENFFAENEQISFGTGVLVDGLDFSDDKMLVGRTFSYSDTQRYRVGPNYLQLPVNQPKNARVHTNQRDGQMTYYVDGVALGQALAAERGLALIPPYDHPHIIAGQGTAALELIEETGDLDALIVPVGGGGLIAGSATAGKGLLPGLRVVGVEPEAGDDTRRSLRAGRRVSVPVPKTLADGLAADTPGELTFSINRRLVDGVCVVSEEEIREAMRFAFERLRIVVEPSGACGLAALLARRVESLPRRVGVIVSGGNIDTRRFTAILGG
ncbi:pyridoxal-phosphate dependent enzyme [Streptomyces mexicanus]|uniref:catalase n=1 Tax=Streptomyces mexicanus TaxID=178566 RepID=A0A7X1HXE9_9ACTN|nr:pyridoxal-phosphate dependent enzyme [Streptomyces mexicanus]MBC2864812.1 pyridoxal-phosphate dependent enzyme [Streptomyces mexicanus]